MRTTLTLDDQLAKTLRERAHQTRKSFKEVVNHALSLGLSVMENPPRRASYVLRPSSMGQPRPGLSLDKALELAARQEDEAVAIKLDMRK